MTTQLMNEPHHCAVASARPNAGYHRTATEAPKAKELARVAASAIRKNVSISVAPPVHHVITSPNVMTPTILHNLMITS